MFIEGSGGIAIALWICLDPETGTEKKLRGQGKKRPGLGEGGPHRGGEKNLNSATSRHRRLKKQGKKKIKGT